MTIFAAHNFTIKEKGIHESGIIINCISDPNPLSSGDPYNSANVYGPIKKSIIGYPYILCNRGSGDIQNINIPDDLYSIDKNSCGPCSTSYNWDSLEKWFDGPTSAFEPRAAIEYAILDEAGEYISLRNCDLLDRQLGGSKDFKDNPLINPRTNEIELEDSCNDIILVDDYWVRLRGPIDSIEPNLLPYVTGINDFIITDLRLYKECSVEFRYNILCSEKIQSSGCWELPPKGCNGEIEDDSASSTASTILFDIEYLEDEDNINIPEMYIPLLISAATTWNDLLVYRQSVVEAIHDIYPSWSGIYPIECVQENIPLDYLMACAIYEAIYIQYLGITRIMPINYILFINRWYEDNPIPTKPPYMMNSDDFTETLVHELGHSLGIGYWDVVDLVIDDKWLDGLMNPSTRLAYNRLVGGRRNRLLIPIEDGKNSKGEGSAGVHWEDNYRGKNYPGGGGFEYPVINDIMLQYFDPDVPQSITDLSINYLLDQGFMTNSSVGVQSLKFKIFNNISNLPKRFCGLESHNKPPNILGHLDIDSGELRIF
ncbi:hypothetical protein EB001_06195 [bacterium]|nr:hypothetical protein [bacterium]